MQQSKARYWRKLDNAAKLFSAASNKNDTRVFRFYCELKEEIVEEILQEALEITLEKYPIFLSVMRKGLFWHYLEKSSLRPIVRKEYREPCSTLYVRDKKDLLFEVTYYKRRINFEVFHALTDGTGASEFVRELAKNYLFLAHKKDGLKDVALSGGMVTVSDQEDDSFSKYYSEKELGKKKSKDKKPSAYQIHRSKSEIGSLEVTEAEIPVKELRAKAKEYGVSMTVLLTAVFLMAIHGKMTKRQEEKPVILMVPVNLRKYFPSDSLLNFFSWIEPGYKFGQGDDSFEKVVQAVNEKFKSELTKENMAKKMNEYIRLEMNPILRFAPLELKNLCISAGARFSEKDITAIFSNMGIINMPEEYAPYIERFGVYTSTPKVELCMCSFGEKIYLGFTSRYDSTNIKRNFFRILQEMGITVNGIEPDFPEEARKGSVGIKVFKIFSFLCIAAVVAAVAADYIVDQKIMHVSLLVSGGILSMWLASAIAFFKRHNLMKNAMWQLLIVTIACILWDVATGWKGWSVEFVLPIVGMVIQISMIIISRIYYRMAKDYMIYFIMAAGYSIILPLIFLLTGMLETVIFSVICIGASVIWLAALIIFKGKEFQEEMQKKFHI